MSDAPLPVTAVIAAYDREDVIGRAIASIQAQTRPPAEIVVVDDASSDATAARAEAAGAIVLRQERNGGAATARNAGIRAATQPWIAFLDSDDEWLPDQLATLWPHTEGRALVTGASLVFDEATGATRRAGVDEPVELTSPLQIIYPTNFVSSGGVLARRDVLLELGGFDTTLRFAEDFDLWVRLLGGRHRGYAIPDPVCRYHLHPGQKTRNLDAARAAQRALIERNRGAWWWSEATFRKRIALNAVEGWIATEPRTTALRRLLLGLARDPRAYGAAARVIAARRAEPS